MNVWARQAKYQYASPANHRRSISTHRPHDARATRIIVVVALAAATTTNRGNFDAVGVDVRAAARTYPSDRPNTCVRARVRVWTVRGSSVLR